MKPLVARWIARYCRLLFFFVIFIPAMRAEIKALTKSAVPPADLLDLSLRELLVSPFPSELSLSFLLNIF